MDALLRGAAHAMADHSFPDRRARGKADTRRAAYARAPLQVRRGGCTTRSMSCGTNVSELLVRWASDTYIRCLLPQLVVHSTACDVSSAHHLLAPCSPRPVLHVRCPPCFAPGFVCHACFPCTYMRTRECIRSVRWACTRASKHVGTCILYCVTSDLVTNGI